MKRRKFFKCMAGIAATLILPVKLSEAEPEVMGVDVGVEGADATIASSQRMNAAAPNDLGGFLVPQEYVDKVLASINVEGGRNSVFRGASRTVKYEPLLVHLPADPNLQVHQDFAEFLRAG